MDDNRTRLNKFIAQSTHVSRRAADEIINAGRVKINDQLATAGHMVTSSDIVTVDGTTVVPLSTSRPSTIIFNKPTGYVCSRNGQGNPTIYELLPPALQHLNSAGRLDKDSSGLLLLSDDGDLLNKLTHPRYQKVKSYEITLDKPLQPLHQQMINDYGITLPDGISKLQIEKRNESSHQLLITMREGRNRQIRRTFQALGYDVVTLHRTMFGGYWLEDLAPGQFKTILLADHF